MIAEIERESMCGVAYCPASTDPDWHACIVCGNNSIEHAHVESRARKPSRRLDPTNIVPLCVPHHREVDERQGGTHSHYIHDLPARGRVYVRLDLHGETLFEKVLAPVESSVAEVVAGIRLDPGADGSAAVLPAGAESPAVEEQSNSEQRGDENDGTSTAEPSVLDESAAEEAREEPVGSGLPDRSGGGAKPVVSSAALPAGAGAGKQASAYYDPSSVAPARNLDSLAPAGPLAEDWRDLTDDDLQAKYDAADAMQGMAFLIKCKAVHAFRENHVRVWRESWADHAIERFNVSRRTCARYANIWEIRAVCGTSLDISPLTDSRSLMAFIGQKAVPDGVVAMEVAVAHHAEFAEPPTVAALAHRLGEEREASPDILLECPNCGHEDSQSKFKERKVQRGD